MPGFDRTTTSYQIISKLAHLRQLNPALGYGTTTERWTNEDVYVFERKFGNNVVITAVNSSDQSYTINNLQTSLTEGTHPDVLEGLLKGDSLHVNQEGQATSFELEANEVAVWEVTEAANTPTVGHVGPMVGQSGNEITISGEAFGQEQGSVLFGNNQATIVSWDNSEIVVNVPDIQSDFYNIEVVTNDNKESNAYADFEVLTGKLIPVRFIVEEATTDYGNAIYLVGNTQELGNWVADKAIGPFFNQIMKEYPTWYYDISVPSNHTLEYKFIKKDSSGNIVWEGGTNRSYVTPIEGTDSITSTWRN